MKSMILYLLCVLNFYQLKIFYAFPLNAFYILFVCLTAILFIIVNFYRYFWYAFSYPSLFFKDIYWKYPFLGYLLCCNKWCLSCDCRGTVESDLPVVFSSLWKDSTCLGIIISLGYCPALFVPGPILTA